MHLPRKLDGWCVQGFVAGAAAVAALAPVGDGPVTAVTAAAVLIAGIVILVLAAARRTTGG